MRRGSDAWKSCAQPKPVDDDEPAACIDSMEQGSQQARGQMQFGHPDRQQRSGTLPHLFSLGIQGKATPAADIYHKFVPVRVLEV
jgi:hypothetical protein